MLGVRRAGTRIALRGESVVRGVIVDLDPSTGQERTSSDRPLIGALALATLLFALAVVIGSAPRVTAPLSFAGVDAGMMTPRERLSLLHRSDQQADAVLRLIHPDAVLSSMPDRFVNEAGPAALRAVISVRGGPGIASVEQPAVIMWTERGTTYWLTSPLRSTAELIHIADELR